MSVLYGAGLRPVSGSTSLLEASQKGVFPTPGSVTPHVHQSGASRPTPSLSHSSEKTGGKNPRASRNSCGFLSRSVLSDCGGGRTVGLKRLVVGCMLGVAVWMVWLLRCGCGDVGCSKITTGKEKRLSQRITALLTRRIPSEQWWGLTAHKLTGITDLRTFMVSCKFPQP